MTNDFKFEKSQKTPTNPKKAENNPSKGKNKQLGGEEQKKHIHVILGPNRFKKFKELKTAFEQNSDVDVVRVCIDEMHESLKKGKIKLRTVLEQQVKLLLENEYLKRRHLVLNLNDVVNEAVHQWIQNKRAEINIHHFPFRQELAEDEQRVALFFVENQFNYDRSVSLDELKKHLKEIGEPRLRRILQKFSDNGLLLSNQLDGIEYYYAPVP